MPVLRSLLRPGSPAFQANAARMAEPLAEVRVLEARVVAESAAKADKFEQRGQLLPRERIARLLDRGSGFLELSEAENFSGAPEQRARKASGPG